MARWLDVLRNFLSAHSLAEWIVTFFTFVAGVMSRFFACREVKSGIALVHFSPGYSYIDDPPGRASGPLLPGHLHENPDRGDPLFLAFARWYEALRVLAAPYYSALSSPPSGAIIVGRPVAGHFSRGAP